MLSALSASSDCSISFFNSDGSGFPLDSKVDIYASYGKLNNKKVLALHVACNLRIVPVFLG